MFNWMLGQLRKGCEKIGYSWKSSELESAEQREEKREKHRPQPNSVFAQFSVVCMFNWILGQLRKTMRRSYIRGQPPNLNRLSRARKNVKNLALSPIQYSCNSQSCIYSIGCSAN